MCYIGLRRDEFRKIPQGPDDLLPGRSQLEMHRDMLGKLERARAAAEEM